MKISLLAAVLLLSSFAPAQNSQTGTSSAGQSQTAPAVPTKVDPAKEADIRKLMQLTGSDKLASQMMIGMEANLRPSLIGSLPPGEYRAQLVDLFFAKLSSKIGAAATDLTIPAYDKYFSDEEIQQLIAFYQTPIGAKSVKVLPQMMSEIMASSQAWAQQLGQDCLKEVLAEHPELKQALEQAQKASKQ